MPRPDSVPLPFERMPIDLLLDMLPEDSPFRDEIIEQAEIGPIAPEFQVSPDAEEQQGVAVARLSNGNAIIVWTDFEGDPTLQTRHIHGQLLDEDGAPIGFELVLSSGSPVHFFEFEVAALVDGGFVVVWTTSQSEANGSGRAVMAQVFAADGTPTTAEFQVNTQPWFDQSLPDVVGLAGGGFVVTWRDQAGDFFSVGDPFGSGIRAQIYTSAGDAVGTEIQVNTTTIHLQEDPSVAALESGGFVIAWTDLSPRATPGVIQIDVRAQAFSSTGERTSDELTLNTDPTVIQQHTDIVGTSDGGFVVVWRESETVNDTISIRGQQFDSQFELIGSEFVISANDTTDRSSPAVAALDIGGFVVTWDQGAPGEDDVYGRTFIDWDSPRSDIFLVTSENDGREYDNEVAPLGNGFIVAWLDDPIDDGSFALVGEPEARIFDLFAG